ncbi:nucleotidyltransferase domain-containing protein [Vibrio tubiashii]|uniref:Polymerase nucleotidyl transferase domain-containing protein n=1 Tax=Vibrio tubiashii ATCC 19109 TaxID=1051646 RepID=F9T4E8_9VIBR|nr:nucleotidyltransferase domain-containing protein [Vibrio tubiashii]AIW13326.1 hypothetical protein IX91_03780 [Vibrio tubiashii ATCC 19109]EGU56059.1 hypothetical protein VITU9109_08862 [Vibrio tubiashii ATCC 19109]EIF04462.1 hypothetical protein VT1337_08326 [Vibrio tubiashii NCIMB 1337 = ATCC 19106]
MPTQYLDLDGYLATKSLSLSQLTAYLDELVDLTRVEGAYVTGSIAEGHGTISSDLDITVVLPVSNPTDFEVRNRFFQSVRVDIEFINQRVVDRIQRVLETMDFEDIHQNFQEIDVGPGLRKEGVLECIGRMLNGRALKPNRTTEAIGQQGMYRYLGHLSRLYSENLYEDVLGFLDSNDTVSAGKQSLQLLDQIYMTKLLAQQIYIDRQKWVPFFLSRHRPDDYLRYLEALRELPLGDGVDGVLRLADEVLS